MFQAIKRVAFLTQSGIMFILIERYRGWKQITDFWEHKMGHFLNAVWDEIDFKQVFKITDVQNKCILNSLEV